MYALKHDVTKTQLRHNTRCRVEPSEMSTALSQLLMQDHEDHYIFTSKSTTAVSCSQSPSPHRLPPTTLPVDSPYLPMSEAEPVLLIDSSFHFISIPLMIIRKVFHVQSDISVPLSSYCPLLKGLELYRKSLPFL